jgi:hypothetical protein
MDAEWIVSLLSVMQALVPILSDEIRSGSPDFMPTGNVGAGRDREDHARLKNSRVTKRSRAFALGIDSYVDDAG